MPTEDKTTERVKARYNRIAPFYDLMEGLLERSRYSRLRELLWSRVEGTSILEVGVGTGKNFPYYPADAKITAIDLSDRMLKRARDRAREQEVRVHLEQMDVQDLRFEENTFDTAVATFVFCSVRDPIRDLMEVARVCKPGGKVILLEHVLSAHRVLGWLMNLVNPVVAWVIGDNINRQTVASVASSGLVVERVTNLGAGIIKLIEARKRRQSS